MQCCRLSICVLPQVHILKPSVHCDAIRRGALWEAIKALNKGEHKDFPGGPMFKASSSNAESMGLIPG